MSMLRLAILNMACVKYMCGSAMRLKVNQSH